jgi:hypothetical protein
MRGTNSFQLFPDGSRWWIVNVYWQHEIADTPFRQITFERKPAWHPS